MGAEIHIGTSGWHYDHWRGPFYPDTIKSGDMLTWYMERLSTVEINNSFYRLPAETTVEEWRRSTGPKFTFALKASRYITHMKKLKTDTDALERLLDRARHLGDKLHVILFQLPPRWKINPERLSTFLDALPETYRYAFEFRDASWHDDRTYDLLRKHNAAFCIFDIAGTRSPGRNTADFVYIRLHGPDPSAYKGQYDDQTLAGWAGALHTWNDQGKTIYCYFDNDENGFAARDALRLQKMLKPD